MNRTHQRILVVDDEEHLALGIAENLQLEGYVTEVVHDGRAALERIRAEEWALVVLDVMMPELDGFSVCEMARAEGNDVPILFLTARSDLDDRVRGLEAGGDDYLPKPFALRELLLRVTAILRRREVRSPGVASDKTSEFDQNVVDFSTYNGRSWNGVEHELTHKEAMILKVLCEREGEVVSRESILETVWGDEASPSTRTIDNFIVRLRKRFERDPEHPRHFHTIRGVGYRFTRERKEPG